MSVGAGDFITALGLFLIVEGAIYALFAPRMAALAQRLMETPPSALRASGLIAAVIGLGLIWLVRG